LENIYSRHQDLRGPHCSLCRLLFFSTRQLPVEAPDSCINHTLKFIRTFAADGFLRLAARPSLAPARVAFTCSERVTTNEHQREGKELCAGAVRVVCGDGAFGHLGQSRNLMSGVRREGQRLRDTTGASMPAMRRRGAAQRDALLPDLRGHGLGVGKLN
jgi:hypothetical protein